MSTGSVRDNPAPELGGEMDEALQGLTEAQGTESWRYEVAGRLMRWVLYVCPFAVAVFTLTGWPRALILIGVTLVSCALFAVDLLRPIFDPRGRLWLVTGSFIAYAVAGQLVVGLIPGTVLLAGLSAVVAGALLSRRALVGVAPLLVLLGVFTKWAAGYGLFPEWLHEYRPSDYLGLRTALVSLVMFSLLGLLVASVIERLESIGHSNAQLYRHALEALASRQTFLAMAAHELRTPLTSLGLILEASELPAATESRERLLASLKRIQAPAQRLRSLVALMFDMAQLDRSQLSLQPVPTDLGAVVRGALDWLQPILARAECEVQLSLAPDVCGTWDPLRLEQIVVNLLTNAARFGAGKPIEVRVTRDDRCARLSVQDHGPGFPPHLLPHLFEPFRRGHGPSYGGLGLGLYISRQLVELHGGRIVARNAPDKGAELIVELPLDTSLHPFDVGPR